MARNRIKTKNVQELYDWLFTERPGEGDETREQQLRGVAELLKDGEGKLVNERVQKVKVLYESLFVEQAEDQSETRAQQLREAVKLFEDAKKERRNFRAEVCGGEITKGDGTTEEVPGLIKQISDLHQTQKKRGDKLFGDIEERLEGGATAVELAETFSSKVKEYREEERTWRQRFVQLMLVSIALSFLALSLSLAFMDVKLESVWDVLTRSLYWAMPFGFVVWYGIFLGGGRAENKKLEELYKHKEVTARGFVGYRKSIEALGTEDMELLKTYMKNLLETMKKDPSSFIKSTGEKHPIATLLAGVTGKDTKDTKKVGEETDK